MSRDERSYRATHPEERSERVVCKTARLPGGLRLSASGTTNLEIDSPDGVLPMLKTLTIKGFRCFREPRVEPLTRVNLFVGKNGSGKTSLLDAAELVAIGSVEGLVGSAVRRGELIDSPAVLTPAEEKYSEHVVNPRTPLLGHELKAGKTFRIEAEGEAARSVECRVEHARPNGTMILEDPTLRRVI